MGRKILVIGSFNLDYVFSVKRFVQPKETYHSEDMEMHFGGKGFNQSVALAKSYSDVYYAATLNYQEKYIKDVLIAQNVKTDFMRFTRVPTGMAFIQVNPDGENCILLNKGANHQFTVEQLIEILNQFNEGDVLLLQNEINLLDQLVDMALSRHLIIALNPSPFTDSILKLPLDKLSYLFINEVEGEAITHVTDPKQILSVLHALYPACTVVLTLGSKGAMVMDKGKIVAHPVVKVDPIDTTAAGDTFTGYFLSMVISGKTIVEALKYASYAAALSVTKKGAMDSIPSLEEVEQFIKDKQVTFETKHT